MDLPSWDEIFYDLDLSLKKDYLILKFNGFGITTHSAEEHLPCCDFFLEKMKFLFPKKKGSAHIYTSLTTKNYGLGKHADDVDVLFWQVKGKTLWIFNEQEKELEPGDVLYIPKAVSHQVISLTPRVGISFGFR
jgi:ribosomal protein L16 Arg81 hydroxylase